MKYVFIDGYNIINSWPELRKIKNSNFQAAREALIERIQEYAAFKEYLVFIVFDAHKVKGSIEKIEKVRNIMVVFTKEGETADSFIERKVNDIGRKKDVLVITSDSLEQQVTFQRGATRMSSLEFHMEVKNTKEIIKKKTKKFYSNSKNWLEDEVDNDILKKLEKIRRNE